MLESPPTTWPYTCRTRQFTPGVERPGGVCDRTLAPRHAIPQRLAALQAFSVGPASNSRRLNIFREKTTCT